jgi:hypothetical protein
MKREVELSINNYTKCLCPVCPVQEDSKCIAQKMIKWADTRKRIGDILEEYPFHPEAYDMEMGELQNSAIGAKKGFLKPQPVEMKELYCCKHVGKSNCGDLKLAICQCTDCTVWKDHGLHAGYYCMHNLGKEL